MPAPTALELLWGLPDRPRRGPKPALTLERIVDEAIAAADADGLANLSMQRLADRLGCAKMALYRYVPGKAELHALMLDRALGPAPEPVAPESDSAEDSWRDPLRRWTLAIFERMRAHPWSQELTIGIRPLGPNEIGWLEAALTQLADTPLSAAERLDTVVLLTGHARGLAEQAVAGNGELEQHLARAVAETLATKAAIYPATVAAFAETASGDRDNALRFGLERILDGLATLIIRRVDERRAD
ncbi:TetR/AcrR family transcriptional regulator [Nocardia stercoris]|uniref:TetR family transcriptional regulator n=1 Tax=Nocardia stercoris TaxID=2483361 RepID=A0A3M2LCZ0_9NOCA|nr:TetR/AcrR family transcriptional regulator C-terminal domain-containing protein [Nocardia stercoris]RMI34956.1 TetR family transcriptional regulator [Nocardia stercoris]